MNGDMLILGAALAVTHGLALITGAWMGVRMTVKQINEEIQRLASIEKQKEKISNLYRFKKED